MDHAICGISNRTISITGIFSEIYLKIMIVIINYYSLK